jgi:hypothetical protein
VHPIPAIVWLLLYPKAPDDGSVKINPHRSMIENCETQLDSAKE